MASGARRLPIFAMGALALLAGLLAGLIRIGWSIPAPAAAYDLVLVHGPLMVCGFFGTVIGLERAVALARPWAYGAPLLSGAGGFALIAGLPSAAAPLMLGGSLIFLVVGIVVVRRQRALYTVTLALGAAAWVVGTASWLATGRVAPAVAAWVCFLVLTIAGERLELSRFMPPSRWKTPGAVAAFAIFLGGAGLLAAENQAGAFVFGLGLVALAVWMFRHDVARRSVLQPGLPRYMAVCLLSGYVWLTVAGVLCLAFGLPGAGPLYDAALHSLFVGFVFAMVFGHVPVILPSVLKVRLPYHPGFYLPLALLHGSLLLRVAGDVTGLEDVRRWGGLLNAVVILGFLLLTAATVAYGKRQGATAQPAATQGTQRLQRR